MFTKLLEDFISINLDEMRFPGFLAKRAKEIKICVENVSKGEGWKKVESCPICDSTDNKILFNRFNINIVQCENCTCGYPEIFPVNTADVYSDAEYLPIAQSDYLENVEYRKERFGKERLKLLASLYPKTLEECSILDVGCGTGWFLELAQEQGCQVFGQELGKDLAGFTSQRLGIQVWQGNLDTIKNNQFDIITLFDVIEHVPNPKRVVNSIFRLLKKGGIALFFTPNLDSYGFKILKENSSLVMPVEHLFYFTPKSIKLLVETSGFSVEYFTTKGMDIPDIYSYYRDELNKEEVAQFLKNNANELQAMIDKSGCANHMRIAVRKG